MSSAVFDTLENGRATVEAAVNDAIAFVLNKCITPASARLTAQQALTVQCDPPSNWGDIVYNGEICTMMRNAPPGTYTPAQICNACNACCASEINQNSYVSLRADCVIDDAGAKGIQQQLLQVLPAPNDVSRATLNKLISLIIAQNINDGIRAVINLQNVNITGVGSIQRVHQDVVINVVYQFLKTPSFNAAIDDYVKAVIIGIGPTAATHPSTGTVGVSANSTATLGASPTSIKSNMWNSATIIMLIILICVVVVIIIKYKHRASMGAEIIGQVKGGFTNNTDGGSRDIPSGFGAMMEVGSN